MIFELNEQQRMIRDMARDFAQREIAPVADTNMYHDETFTLALIGPG